MIENENNSWNAERQRWADKKTGLGKILNNEDFSFQDKIRGIVKKEVGISLDRLCDILDISANHAKQEISDLESQGYKFHISEEDKVHQITHLQENGLIYDATKLFEGRDLRIGIVSDTHGGSNKEAKKELNTMYEVFKKAEIKVVYHAGDMTAGRGVYRGQDRDLRLWGQDEQVQSVIKTYPKVEGITTYTIGGNHDECLFQTAGAPDPLVAIASARKDIKYLGQIEANVKLANNAILRLSHPDGGGAYALSYLPQKYINAMEGGSKPDIIVFGHWHTSFYMNYRNIHSLNAGCFERQNTLLLRKGIMPVIGGWIVDIHISKEGNVNQFAPKFTKFF